MTISSQIRELGLIHAANLTMENKVRAQYEAAVYLAASRAWAYQYRLARKRTKESARDLYIAIRDVSPDLPVVEEFHFLKAA